MGPDEIRDLIGGARWEDFRLFLSKYAMRKWINLLLETNQGGRKVLLTDLYTVGELRDEGEKIAHETSPIDWEIPLTVHVMSPEQSREVEAYHGVTVFVAYEKDATKAQKRIVAQKIKDFDEQRIIVLSANEIVDGNHHLIAAIISNKPVQYIDLSELDELTESSFPV
jgi:hypothetical protein